jgi:anti-sigma regulatory factor (Ser/Thr protein kinase)
MLELVTVSVTPKPEMICVPNAGLAALCEHVKLSGEKAHRLQLATEEIFIYAVTTLRKAGLNTPITFRFRANTNGFQIVLDYAGPKGSLDNQLNTGQIKTLPVKDFQVLGLCLAINILDSLKATYWPLEGRNSYSLSCTFPESGTSAAQS